MLRSALCAVAGHSIDRHRVWHDGSSFRTRCQTCSQPMIRDRNGWRKFDFEMDANGNRGTHPVTGEVA
jgi:hypothetical protein